MYSIACNDITIHKVTNKEGVMDLVAVRSAKPGDLPFENNSIYKYHAQGRYPDIIFKIDGKLFFDRDAFKEMACKKRDEQITRVMKARRGLQNS